MATVSVRYIVNDVDEAIAFYCGHLAFHEDMHPAPTFAMLSRGDLRLCPQRPGGGPGGGQAMPDGTVPEPGGWNRFSLEVSDLDALVEVLRDAGAHFRNDIVAGVGGRQILLDDPSGNPVELFEPTLPEAALAPFLRTRWPPKGGRAGQMNRRQPRSGTRSSRAIRALQPGEVVSYREVARRAGFPPTGCGVGHVLGSHPGDDLPWWRVVRADARLAAPGLSRQSVCSRRRASMSSTVG